ncbi:uncharacterized protein [Panulirus ornatus]|uniref:uncharacterized protein n=1 Tax=Panulirus ornatus TaxID=150431 RepID=UPI003A89B9E9
MRYVGRVNVTHAMMMAAVVMMLAAVVKVRARTLQNTVLLTDKGLPASVHSFSKAVNNKCECRMFCFVNKDCHFATVQQEASGLVCYGTDLTDVYSSLEPAVGAYTFYWTEYRHIGVRYYRLYTKEVDWFTASERCKDEGGQLMVADTDDRKNECEIILRDNGLSEVWIGLFATFEELSQNILPAWQVQSGAIIRETPVELIDKHRCFYYKLNVDIYETSNSDRSCGKSLPYICQRDW